MAESLEDVPQSLQKRPEFLEQKTLAAAASKNVGNDFLKDGQTDMAINSYTLAIRLDDANHLFYSNRCAAYQALKLWEQAITDAEKVCTVHHRIVQYTIVQCSGAQYGTGQYSTV